MSIHKTDPKCLKTLGFCRVENLLLLYEMSETDEKKGKYHPDAEWQQWLDFASGETSGTTPATAMLVISDGRSPTSPQIRSAKERMPINFDTAVIASSLMVRAATTAFSWVRSLHIKAFKPEELEAAMDYIRITPNVGVRAAVRSMFTALRLGCVNKR